VILLLSIHYKILNFYVKRQRSRWFIQFVKDSSLIIYRSWSYEELFSVHISDTWEPHHPKKYWKYRKLNLFHSRKEVFQRKKVCQKFFPQFFLIERTIFFFTRNSSSRKKPDWRIILLDFYLRKESLQRLPYLLHLSLNLMREINRIRILLEINRCPKISKDGMNQLRQAVQKLSFISFMSLSPLFWSLEVSLSSKTFLYWLMILTVYTRIELFLWGRFNVMQWLCIFFISSSWIFKKLISKGTISSNKIKEVNFNKELDLILKISSTKKSNKIFISLLKNASQLIQDSNPKKVLRLIYTIFIHRKETK